MRGLLFSVLIFVVFGCQLQNDHVGGQMRPKFVRTVVSLSPSTSELLGSNASISLMIGRTASCNFPPSIARFPVVAGVKPDYEAIKKLHPDAIILDQSLYSDQDMAQIRALGTEVLAINANTVDGFIDQIYELGRLVQNEAGFSAYADKIMQVREAARTTAPKPPVKIAILSPGPSGNHLIAAIGSFTADLVKQGGFEPVGPSGNAFVPLNAEFLVAQNPDFIITAGASDNFMKDPRFASLAAIKNKRVFSVNSDILLRRGSRVDVLIQGISQIVLRGTGK